MNNISGIFILIILMLASAFFSSAETGMSGLNRYRFKKLAKKGDNSAQIIHELLSNPDQLFSSIRLGSLFTILLYSSILTQLIIHNFGHLSLLQSILLTTAAWVIITIFALVTPKTLAANYPHFIISYYPLPLKYLLRLLQPVFRLTKSTSHSFLRIIGVKINTLPLHLEQSQKDLKTVDHENREQFPKQDSALLRLLDLNYITVEDIMIPRSEIEAIDIGSNWRLIQHQIINWQHTYILFYESELNNVLGIIHLKKILQLIQKQQLNKDNVQNHLEDCHFIPESTTLTNQFLNFQNSHTNTSIVVDEYGEIKGLITLQDILEEVVGEFEQSQIPNNTEIRTQADGTVLIAGSTYIRDINRELDWDLPEDGPKTISGLIIEVLENIPKNPIGLAIGKYKIEVISTHKNTINIVKVQV